MPRKNIYIKEADEPLWEEAERRAGGSVSALLVEALRRYVEEAELKERSGMETIRVEKWRGPDDWPYEVEFVGRWLVYPEDETRTSEPGYDAGAYYGVALTQRGNIAVYIRHVNDGFAPILEAYNSFEAAERAGQPQDILAMAAAGIGADYVQKLDI